MSIDKEIDEVVSKMKSSHKFYQRQLLASADAHKATLEALAATRESNAELVRAVTTLCSDMRSGLEAVMRELAAQKKAPPSKPTAMHVTRDDDGKISGASFH